MESALNGRVLCTRFHWPIGWSGSTILAVREQQVVYFACILDMPRHELSVDLRPSIETHLSILPD